MRTLFVSFVLGFCALAIGCKQKTEPAVAQNKNDVVEENHKPRFTISKETTYVTGPVDKDGYIDYAAALNERLGKGVTPENNANVLIWKALGPRPEGGRGMPAEFFKLMGMEEPPEKGEYFVDLQKFAREHLKLEPAKQKELDDQMLQAIRHPWSTKDYPLLAAWIKANEKPLALVVEATKRSHYFSPLVPTQSEKGSSGLLGALLSGAQKCRHLTSSLACRAMLNTSEGQYDEAWQDLVASHRLARHLGSGGTLIEALIGFAMDSIASRSDLAFLEKANFDAKKIDKCLSDLQELPSLPDISKKIDLTERFMLFDTIMMVDRYGPQVLSKGGDLREQQNEPNPFRKGEGVNWDPALKNANRWYNRMVEAMREQDRFTREMKLQEIEEDLKTSRRERTGFQELARLLGDGQSTPDAKGTVIGNVIINLMLPAVDKLRQASDRAEQTQRNLHAAFALAAYQREKGSYPKTLDELAPKYLAKVPNDYFTGKPLVYRPNEKGYLLYSFGPNGKDDDGRGREDDPPADDLSVRMPMATTRPK